MADAQTPKTTDAPALKADVNQTITPPLDGSPVKTQVARLNTPWVPKTVAEHNAWVDSLADEGALESPPA